MLKDWTKFEISFFIIGTILTVAVTIIFKSIWVEMASTLLYFWTAILQAKGKYICYIFGILCASFYAYVSYINLYYGEVILEVCCTIPLMVAGLINWLRHQDDTDTVIVKEITKKELTIVLLSQILLFIIVYYLLKAFNTNNLIPSTLSVLASVVATYLNARRCEYGFISFIINDLILIVLWGIPVVNGDLTLIPVLLCPVLLLIGDIYGVYNWKRIKIRQSAINV